MLKIATVLITLSLLTFFSNDKKKILFFGDSITEAGVQKDGYITQIQSLIDADGLSDDIDLVGKGIGGNKVYDLYLRMQNDVINESPDIVFIYIGVNDVWHKQSHGTGTDPDKFVKFYQAIIDSLVTRNIEVILCTPGVIGEKIDYSNPLDGDLNHYSNLIISLAKKNNLILCDLRGAMLDHNREYNKNNVSMGILTNDSVHLNKRGNKLVADKLISIIKMKI